MTERATMHHATALLLGARAVLLRGASGSGKSHVALDLLIEARRSGVHAALIGDDQVMLEPASGRLVVRAAPQLAGRAEVRGLGIVRLAHEPAGIVAMVVDFVRECPPRLPDREAGDLTADIAGIRLPRLPLWTEDPAPVARIGIAFAALTRAGDHLLQNPLGCEFDT